MQFEKYGVTFREIEHKDIEMVRQWRNDPEVARHMISRDYITPEMQEKWFQGVKERNERHYVVSYDGKDVGLYSIKDLNPDDGTAECAMYLAHGETRNTHLPYLISIAAEVEINRLGIQRIKIYILDENIRAIRYNKSFGFKPTSEVRNGNVRLYWLDYTDFKKSIARFKKVLKLED